MLLTFNWLELRPKTRGEVVLDKLADSAPELVLAFIGLIAVLAVCETINWVCKRAMRTKGTFTPPTPTDDSPTPGRHPR
ncbi:MAG: hypothetical protein AMXMBFR77_28550 [Phycisphaerales bacterium]